MDRARELALALPAALEHATTPPTSAFMARLAEALRARAEECLRWLSG